MVRIIKKKPSGGLKKKNMNLTTLWFYINGVINSNYIIDYLITACVTISQEK